MTNQILNLKSEDSNINLYFKKSKIRFRVLMVWVNLALIEVYRLCNGQYKLSGGRGELAIFRGTIYALFPDSSGFWSESVSF